MRWALAVQMKRTGRNAHKSKQRLASLRAAGYYDKEQHQENVYKTDKITITRLVDKTLQGRTEKKKKQGQCLRVQYSTMIVQFLVYVVATTDLIVRIRCEIVSAF